MQENNKDLVLNQELELNANDLERVSGGCHICESHFFCPVHKTLVWHFDMGYYKGRHIYRWECDRCHRLYSESQCVGDEDLTIDYTNIEYDDFKLF